MFKLLITMMVIVSSVNAATVGDTLQELKAFKAGLAKRQLLLRHQVNQVIGEVSNANGIQGKMKVLKSNKDFFDYLATSSKNMGIDKSSKLYVKKKSKHISSMLEKLSIAKPDAKVNAQASVKVDKVNNVLSAIEGKKVSTGKLADLKSSHLPRTKIVRTHRPAAAGFKYKLESIGLGLLAGTLLLVGFLGSTIGRMIEGRRGKEALESGLKLKLFKKSDIPAIVVDGKEAIFWTNKAAQAMSLTKGSSFFFEQELEIDSVTGEEFFSDEAGRSHIVERKSVVLGGKDYEMVIFVSTISAMGSKSFRMAKGSRTLSGALEGALQKYDYLFSSSSIPVGVEQKCELAGMEKSEVEIFNKAVYLAYQMAKDVQGSRLDISVDQAKGRTSLQFDIKGLRAQDISFDEEFALESGEIASLGELWSELEARMSKREARVFMYENKKSGRDSFSVILSFSNVHRVGRLRGVEASA